MILPIALLLSMSNVCAVCPGGPDHYGPAENWRSLVNFSEPGCVPPAVVNYTCLDERRAEVVDLIDKIEARFIEDVCRCLTIQDPVAMFDCIVEAANAAEARWTLIKYFWEIEIFDCCQVPR